MTRKPRTAYTDHTRAARSARRQAILDAAAQRMGEPSWSVIESRVRHALEMAETDGGAALHLRHLLMEFAHAIQDGPLMPPADMEAIRDRYPARKAGRPPTKKPRS